MKNISRMLWGLVLIILGLVWALRSLGVINVNFFFDGWWTLFIIVPSIISFFEPSNESKTSSLLCLLLGVLLLLSAQGIINIMIIWKMFIPIILIILGINLMFGFKKNVVKVENKEIENIVSIFGEQIINKDEFDGANLDCVFGSIVLDLSKIEIKEDTYIKASVIFGGIDIIVPDDCLVKVNGTPVFGGINNYKKKSDSKKIIYVDAFCLFGGIDIK